MKIVDENIINKGLEILAKIIARDVVSAQLAEIGIENQDSTPSKTVSVENIKDTNTEEIQY